MRITRRKKLFIAGVTVVGLMGGSALAYWTTTGSGTGSATVGTSNGLVTLVGTVASPAIVPGESRTVVFKASNLGSSTLYVGTITLASVTASDPDCGVSDFTMPNVVSNSTVGAGLSNVSIAGSGTLSFANSNVSQDACKGATITLNLTSN